MNISTKETKVFQSEAKQLLHLMIHSLYSNKEIFLRELISNASDAADKLRFLALSNPALYQGDSNLRIKLSYNKNNRTITIDDNGIGMLREEVINNLGTIAKSGTKEFIESMETLKSSKNNQLIGQFGVGFYSVFIVANKVTVATRSVHSVEGVLWESNGEGTYTIDNIPKLDRGTTITLYLRDGEDEFLEEHRLKNIISKYSDHINIPVEMEINTTNKDNNNKKTYTWEQVNKAQALWVRNKTEITNEEYKEFYKHISHDFKDPLLWSHNHVEGKQEYISLLYIPSQAPWDIWNHEYKRGLKLYVQRVFIMDDAKQFMPNYLRFVHGVIDSNDLPLNISREILQENRITQNLKISLTKRILNMLEKLTQDDTKKYQSFWKEFGLLLKEGLGEDTSNNKIIANLLRFASTYDDNIQQTVSLKDYVGRMPKEQTNIYYIAADSYKSAKNSPHLELLRNKGLEALLLFDRIDEWMMSHLTEFNGISFQSVSKANTALEELANKDQNIQENIEKQLQPFITRVKNYLGDRIKEVRLTHRLTDTPVVVTTDTNDMTTQMAKLFTAAGQSTPDIKYIFEINPKHNLIKHVVEIDKNEIFNEWIELLFEQALLIERGTLEDPSQFIRRVNHLLTS